MLNEEGVPGRFRASKGWSPSTVSRILRNEKYIGRWIWNRTQTRRDPKTGRRKQFPKPESAWIVNHDDTLRIVPQQLWDEVQQRLKEVSRTWPGGEGKRGFEDQCGGRVRHYPTHLLSGAMICGVCGAAIGQVSGKSGGYYGCLAAPKHACENRLLVRRTLCEDKILKAIIEMLSAPVNIRQLMIQIEAAMAKQQGELPQALKLKEATLVAERRRVARFVEFIGDGRASKAVTQELYASERRVEVLEDEIRDLKRTRYSIFEAPSTEWIEERVRDLQDLLERRTQRSAIILRRLLGKIRLEPTESDRGKPYYRAVSSLNVVPLLEEGCGNKDEEGSNTLRWRERRDSNSRPPA
jgi:site-specific DNA recombinase